MTAPKGWATIWPESDLAILQAGVESGKSVGELAQLLPEHSVNAIKKQLEKTRAGVSAKSLADAIIITTSPDERAAREAATVGSADLLAAMKRAYPALYPQ